MRQTKVGQAVLVHHRCSFVLGDAEGLCGGDHPAVHHQCTIMLVLVKHAWCIVHHVSGDMEPWCTMFTRGNQSNGDLLLM